MAGAQQSFPLNMEELERLVKIMHAPGNPKDVAEANSTLQVLQRSPQGWDMADALLNSNDLNSRFFGALTFTIKINADAWVLSLSRLDYADSTSQCRTHRGGLEAAPY